MGYHQRQRYREQVEVRSLNLLLSHYRLTPVGQRRAHLVQWNQMGVRSRYFCATIEELKAHARGWVVPTYGGLVERRNPFTGEPAKELERLTEWPPEPEEETIYKLVPNEAHEWRLGDELHALMGYLLNADEESAARLDCLALIGDEYSETWVSEVPQTLVRALASLSASDHEALYRFWKERFGEPPPALDELIKIAKAAVAQNRQMFCYTTL